MRVFVVGATGVLGTSALRALFKAGHDVGGLTRSEAKAEQLKELGVRATVASLFDSESLRAAFEGYEVVCNLATHIPVGMAGMRPGAWKVNDRLHTHGTHLVVSAAKQAGVRRIIQESASFAYTDGGDDWLDESSPLSVTRATEPIAEAETNAASFVCGHRTAVVLRFGEVVGDDPWTRWRLDRARAGHAIGLGDPAGWTHVVHPDDVGTAIVAALYTPSGVYNVGAEPVLRKEFVSTFGQATGHQVGFMPRMVVRFAGDRWEPLARSHRVSSRRLMEQGGWSPVHPKFASSWLDKIAVRVS
ncbi:MAG: NAD(P)H-binding protein [Propionibacteriales bacterium]|nr:NAD(P)H-binding protein [Propionibacteriales bacterium]